MDNVETDGGPVAENLDAVSAQLDALAAQGDAVDPAEGEDVTPPSAEQMAAEQAEKDQVQQDSEDMAAFAVEMAEQTVVMVWPFLEYDEQTRQRVAAKLAPVLVKHGGEPPPWLAAYKEELQFAFVLAVVAAQTVRQIREHEANQENEQDAEPERKPTEQE